MTALTAVASSVASSYCSKARTLKFRGGAQSPKGTGAWCKISLPPSRTQPEPVSLGWLNLSGHLNLITANESTSTPSLPLHRQAVRKSKTNMQFTSRMDAFPHSECLSEQRSTRKKTEKRNPPRSSPASTHKRGPSCVVEPSTSKFPV
ncbi:uncharacterized protein [Dermacentor albipictus]|uniref:uncharacterized protein isoform X3 n=1 Tax=Dermacentor albipictus TaxID=60249 RepID=UPI0038FC9CD6